MDRVLQPLPLEAQPLHGCLHEKAGDLLDHARHHCRQERATARGNAENEPRFLRGGHSLGGPRQDSGCLHQGPREARRNRRAGIPAGPGATRPGAGLLRSMAGPIPDGQALGPSLADSRNPGEKARSEQAKAARRPFFRAFHRAGAAGKPGPDPAVEGRSAVAAGRAGTLPGGDPPDAFRL
jgi:hypothetical protein